MLFETPLESVAMSVSPSETAALASAWQRGISVIGISFLQRFIDRIERIAQESTAIKEGIVNQSELLNDKLSEIISGIIHEQSIINAKFGELIEIFSNSRHQHSDTILVALLEILQSIDNKQRIINGKLGELISSSMDERHLLNEKLSEIIAMLPKGPSRLDGGTLVEGDERVKSS